LASVDKPSPATVSFGKVYCFFYYGKGGGNPSSESDELDDLGLIYFLLLFRSIIICMSAISSAVLPPSFLDRLERPNPPIASFGNPNFCYGV
jgi:hypothetical protein